MKRLVLILTIALTAAAQTAPIPSYKQLTYPPLKQVTPPEPAELIVNWPLSSVTR